MKRNNLIILLSVIVLMSFVLRKDLDWFKPPFHFPKPVYDFKQNPLDSSKINLGRILFYDPILSKNNTISCASCHSPYNAFAHSDHELSHGIFDSIGNRNAPALFNLAWQKSFMWDGAVNHLDVQALAPISHPKEMGSDISEVIKKLSKSNEYKNLFFAVYKDSTISSSKILKALSQFQLTLVSANAKYDSVKLGKVKFTFQEQNGYKLFQKNCASCHTEPLFSNYNFENNGLPLDSILNDLGRYVITLNENDKRKFKVPSLRNLSYTYPYMHDGRFKTLKEVVNHYSSGLEKSKILSTKLNKPKLLKNNEKVDIIAFLLTLNDKDFVFDKKHQFIKL